MRRQQFTFDLPEEQIAQQPIEPRSASRLLVLDRQQAHFQDRVFSDLLEFLDAGDLLVLNDTMVMAARLFGHKSTGGAVEVLIERVLAPQRALAQVRASKSPKPGSTIVIGDTTLEVGDRQEEFYHLHVVAGPQFESLMAIHGHVPLPPYIRRPDCATDVGRYQTVYARNPGAVAAPTAGLHFDQALMQGLQDKGVHMGFVTLHVGAGTFQPMRAERIVDHKMHSERIVVEASLCARIADIRSQGGRVVAVGTTTLRSLESAWQDGLVQPFEGSTNIFIYPGIKIRSVDALITNFHLPESTLLMLICALAGTRETLAAYRHAVEKGYRFYSYGDAMLIC
jgi:S-adenosylmethionine:tRNA ribosyltransferase-isomerase